MSLSVRARLTLWHTSVLAVLLVLVAGGAYTFVAYSTRARTDAALLDALSDLRTEISAERKRQPSTERAAHEVLNELRFRSISFVVYDAMGRTVAASIPRPPRPGAGEETEPAFDQSKLAARVAGVGRTPAIVAVDDPEGGYRAAIDRVRFSDGSFVLAAAQAAHAEAETLGEARLAIAIAIPITLMLAWVGGSFLARRSLAPMVAMREQASRIGASTLAERLPIARPSDEVGQLAGVFNDLLARLEQSFAQQRQFMADASHELRTPVAVVQHEASVALSKAPRTAAEYEDSLQVVQRAARRLRRIVDDLFLLARADAGELPVRHDPVYLDEIVNTVARELLSLAESRGIVLESDASVEVPAEGDEALLHRLLVNLVDNAIKYSHAGARVAVRLTVLAKDYRITVEDTGPGIPPDLHPRIFDRFVRADAARSHDGDSATSGAGLGLAIARWIAEAHGGTLELVRSSPQGSLFELRLPKPSGS